jgi:hypothetical protein
MESADREERLVVRFALGLASLVLAAAGVGAVIFGLVLFVVPPEVGVRPGVQSYVEVPEDGPITNCGGGTSLRVALLGPRVRADTVQHARQAARACAWTAHKNVAIGTILLLLLLPILYVMLRILIRLEGANAELTFG